uniref:Integrase catalytic domain-containing protein n=1 Tax=Ananas comosus var. bracteatus TaxID=296719 RepID=A0A6V7NYH7_ANACO|nr:unnamed protein product [Ananas comosus var. bracteatus]
MSKKAYSFDVMKANLIFDYLLKGDQVKLPEGHSESHNFLIVATNYFTKWIEAIPWKKATQKKVIEFIETHVIHRFGIPETIIADQRAMFTGAKGDLIVRDGMNDNRKRRHEHFK